MRRPYWLGDPSTIDDLAAAAYGGAHPGYAMAPAGPSAFPGNRIATGYQTAGLARQAVPYNRIMPTVPGAPALGFRDQSVGLGTVTFTASSGTTLTMSGSPGRPFKGRRLMLDISRSGTSATGLVTVSSFLIGDVNQLVGRSSLLATAFAPNSFGADGQYSACAPALSITLGLTISAAPTMTDTVTVGGQINGETIGS